MTITRNSTDTKPALQFGLRKGFEPLKRIALGRMPSNTVVVRGSIVQSNDLSCLCRGPKAFMPRWEVFRPGGNHEWGVPCFEAAIQKREVRYLKAAIQKWEVKFQMPGGSHSKMGIRIPEGNHSQIGSHIPGGDHSRMGSHAPGGNHSRMGSHTPKGNHSRMGSHSCTIRPKALT